MNYGVILLCVLGAIFMAWWFFSTILWLDEWLIDHEKYPWPKPLPKCRRCGEDLTVGKCYNLECPIGSSTVVEAFRFLQPQPPDAADRTPSCPATGLSWPPENRRG